MGPNDDATSLLEPAATAPSAAIGPVRWAERHTPLAPAARRTAITVIGAIVVGLLSGATAFLVVARDPSATASPFAALVAGALGAALASAVSAIVAQAAAKSAFEVTVYVGRDGVERITETASGAVRDVIAFEDVAHALRERTSRPTLFGELERITLDLVDTRGNVLFALVAEHRRGRPRAAAALIARVTHEYLDRRITRVKLRERWARADAPRAAVLPIRSIEDAEAAVAAVEARLSA